MQELHHPHIIGLRDVFYLQKTIFLALEYMPFELTHVIRDTSLVLKEEQVKCIIQQIVQAVEFLHANFVMHRVRVEVGVKCVGSESRESADGTGWHD